jgi:hypothetical protein
MFLKTVKKCPNEENQITSALNNFILKSIKILASLSPLMGGTQQNDFQNFKLLFFEKINFLLKNSFIFQKLKSS